MSEDVRSGGQGPPPEQPQPERVPSDDLRSEDDGSPPHVLPGAKEQPCANHPNRLTMVTCSDCGKPLCPDCMVYSAVGIKCKECARMPRSARVMLRPDKFMLATAAGLATAIALGFAYYYILGSLGFFFVFIFVSAGIGYAVGEAVSRTSGRYHGWQTAAAAAVATLIGFFLPPLTAAFLSYGVNWQTVVFALSARGIINWLVMLFAAYLAWSRNR